MLSHEITESIKRVELQLKELMQILKDLKKQQELIHSGTPVKVVDQFKKTSEVIAPIFVPIETVSTRLEPIPPTGMYLGKYDVENQSYQLELNSIYKGQVRPIERVLPNVHASILHNCSHCGQDFYGTKNMLLGKSHLHHRCTIPYGDSRGERLKSVSSTKFKKKGLGDGTDILKKFEEMVWDDYTPDEIVKELGLSPSVVKNYFVEEGLI